MTNDQFYQVRYKLWETAREKDFTKPMWLSCMVFNVKHFVATISNESIVLFGIFKKKLMDKSNKVKTFLTTIISFI